MRNSSVLAVAFAVVLLGSSVCVPDAAFAKKKKTDCAANAVQGKVDVVSVGGFQFCTSLATLYSVPAGKRLVIEWMAAESAIFGGNAASHPVEVDVVTFDGTDEIFYPLIRLVDPIVIGDSFFLGSRWQGPVRLYSEGGHAVQVRMCFDSWFEFQESVGTVGFSGCLIDS